MGFIFTNNALVITCTEKNFTNFIQFSKTVVCLDAKGLWKLGQSFILAGFTLTLPRSAPCGTEQTTIDTGCDPAFPRNCVDHQADCNLFKTTTLLNSH